MIGILQVKLQTRWHFCEVFTLANRLVKCRHQIILYKYIFNTFKYTVDRLTAECIKVMTTLCDVGEVRGGVVGGGGCTISSFAYAHLFFKRFYCVKKIKPDFKKRILLW